MRFPLATKGGPVGRRGAPFGSYRPTPAGDEVGRGTPLAVKLWSSVTVSLWILQTTGLNWKFMFIRRMRDRAKSSHYFSTACMLLVRCAPGAACTTTTHHRQPQGGFTAIASEPSVPTDGHRNKPRIQLSRLLAFLSAVGAYHLWLNPTTCCPI